MVLIILARRSATPSHTDLPFTHNTLTFSFACLCRHCPIRIHHTHRLPHADFDLFFCLLGLTIAFFFFFSLSRSFCLFLSSSVLHSYLSSRVLPLRQQADRFWMSHPIRLIPSALCLFLSPSLLLLHRFSQPKRAKEGVASLNMNSSPHTFPLCFLPPTSLETK